MGREGYSLLEMVRAPFLSAIIFPLVLGTLIAVSITGSFNLVGYILAMVIGVSLHISTNVYNDIYDTKQGADDLDSQKSDYSGGSGILVNEPGLEETMFLIARSGIVVGLLATVLLSFFVDPALWPYLVLIFIVSSFLSKYYTAPPFKFAYRGMGEIMVWLGFGPLAILLASVGQNLGLHPVIITAMPITGLSTLFIVWMGEMIDLKTDRAAGKRGLVARFGKKKGAIGYIFIHVVAVINVVILGLYMMNPGWPLLIAILPHAYLLPRNWMKIREGLFDDEVMTEVSRSNFLIYASFSLTLLLGAGLDLWLRLYM